eukprot:Sspe_Gene.28733::Locus_13191_Transcript_1_1_Confidence_1.000_Length_1175::g.28733::m.28733
MKTMKNHELHHNTLSMWSRTLEDRMGVLEEHLANLLPPPTPPTNQLSDDDEDEVKQPQSPLTSGHQGPLPSIPTTSFHVHISTSLYLALEAITHHLRSERSIVYQHIPRSDEMQAVCMVNGGSLKPASVKVPVSSGWPGQVFITGMAVNVSNVYANSSRFDTQHDKKHRYRTRSILCFPLTSLDSNHRIGVIQLLNKNRGTATFTADDEAALAHYSTLVSYLLQKYPVDAFNNCFDPSSLHRIVPFVPREPQTVILPSISSRPQQLIYRTNQSGRVMGKNRTPIALHDGEPILDGQAAVGE